MNNDALSHASLLVIGYGNTLRGDDGVGPRVAEAVGELNLPGVHTLICPLLTPELANPISRAGKVIFVDAAVDAPKTGQWRNWSLMNRPRSWRTPPTRAPCWR